jgi:hypothetical protein
MLTVGQTSNLMDAFCNFLFRSLPNHLKTGNNTQKFRRAACPEVGVGYMVTTESAPCHKDPWTAVAAIGADRFCWEVIVHAACLVVSQTLGPTPIGYELQTSVYFCFNEARHFLFTVTSRLSVPPTQLSMRWLLGAASPKLYGRGVKLTTHLHLVLRLSLMELHSPVRLNGVVLN